MKKEFKYKDLLEIKDLKCSFELEIQSNFFQYFKCSEGYFINLNETIYGPFSNSDEIIPFLGKFLLEMFDKSEKNHERFSKLLNEWDC